MAGENSTPNGNLQAIRNSIATLAAAAPASAGATAANQTTIIGHVDGIETALTTLVGYVDGLEGFSDNLETLITSTNSLLTTQAGYVDGLETLLTTQAGYLDGVESGLTAIAAKLPVLGPATAAESLSVTPSSSGFAITGPMTSVEFLANMRSTPAHSSVASAATSTTILAANANRKGARIFNSDANPLYLDLSGGTAVAASRAQVKLATGEGYDINFGNTGLITGIWDADGAGAASVVEFT